jgi:hypothetical protein
MIRLSFFELVNPSVDGATASGRGALRGACGSALVFAASFARRERRLEGATGAWGQCE